MDIQKLKYFIEIADAKNISQAARNLFVTQPTLSLSLKKMEQELNMPLFVHEHEPFQLTLPGKMLYEKGKKIVHSFDDLMDEMRTMQQHSPKQSIRLGLTTLFSLQFMEQISQFIATHPDVELNIRHEGSNKLQHLLANNLIDIALVSFPNTEEKDIDIEPLETTTKGYNVHVVVPEDNPLSQKEELTFYDLKDQSFASLTEDFKIGKMLIEQAHAHGYQPNIAIYNNDVQILIRSLKQSCAICLLPIEYKSTFSVTGLKWIPLKDKFNYYPIGIGLRKDYVCSKEINELISLIKNN
ncbi:HTH-type transcriptional regulator GltC [Jeotgalibaca dankookensis]|uniref:HTH-type transcriptional regulator GltC n=1 Tax=Jeotgalibaca dankookensis TaxID=708126 RepID=A0A1S6IRQ8_9LACT|nr:LysR family transcriptional regulator [Jeotgalibaca dankookensis]AQS54235.1 HTH-type transcriptional regulator GltC [Jeotgalibaca dankookensis]